MPSPWKHPKTGMFWLRVDVPEPLRPLIGVTSIKRTLKTKDPAEAKLRFHAARAEVDRQLEQARLTMRLRDELNVREAVSCWFERLGEDSHTAIDRLGMVLTIRELSGAAYQSRLREDPASAISLDARLDSLADDMPDFGKVTENDEDDTSHICLRRLSDGSLFVAHRAGYPFLATLGSEVFITRLKAFEVQSKTKGLVKADLARAILSAEKWQAVAPEVDDVISSMSLDLPRPELRNEIARALLERLAFDEQPGTLPNLRSAIPLDWPTLNAPRSRTPETNAFADQIKSSSSAQSPKLSEVFEQWAATKAGSKVVAEWRLACERWIELHGDTAIHLIERKMVNKFRDTLYQLPAKAPRTIRQLSTAEQIAWANDNQRITLSGASVKKAVSGIGVMIDFAANELCVPELEGKKNQARGVSIDTKSDKVDRQVFSDEAVRSLFSQPLMVDPNYGGVNNREADFWISLLAATSGARLEELAAARPSNVRKQDGVWGFFIERDTRAKRMDDQRAGRRRKRAKTEHSYRVIPLHSVVVRAGFLRFVEARRRSGAEWLFDLPVDQFGSRSSALSKRLNRAIDQCGLEDERLVFHSWRHTFKRKLRRGQKSDLVLDMLTGHAPRTEGDKYGGVEPVTLKERCEELVYKGVDWAPIIACGQARARRCWSNLPHDFGFLH